MGKTFITCHCGGTVVLDMSGNLKLVAVSFHVTTEGVNNFVMDLQKGKDHTPSYVCTVCNSQFSVETIGDCTAVCAVCQQPTHISDLSATSYITPICNNCVAESKSGKSPKVADVFSLPRGFRAFDLSKILFKRA